jgi:hypothetical protein
LGQEQSEWETGLLSRQRDSTFTACPLEHSHESCSVSAHEKAGFLNELRWFLEYIATFFVVMP